MRPFSFSQGSIQFFKKLQNQEYRLAVYATDSYNRTHPLSSERVASRATAVVALLFCLALALLDDDVLLRWYPVLINAAMLALFAGSLFVGMPVIERLARLQEPDLAEAGVRYTRQVTKVWVGFFVINGTIAAALTLWAPLAWWTLYNGLIAYLLMGLLFSGEWLVRQRVRGRP